MDRIWRCWHSLCWVWKLEDWIDTVEVDIRSSSNISEPWSTSSFRSAKKSYPKKLQISTNTSGHVTASCKWWVQRFCVGSLTKKFTKFLLSWKKLKIDLELLKMFLGEVVVLSIILWWPDHENDFEWQQYCIHQYHDGKAINNCIGHEAVHSANQLKHSLNLIKV